MKERKRLFAVRPASSSTPPMAPFFADKREAKEERDRLNGNGNGKQYVVTYGPDHHKFKH